MKKYFILTYLGWDSPCLKYSLTSTIKTMHEKKTLMVEYGVSQKLVGWYMDNFKRGLHYHVGVGAKAVTTVCLNKFKHHNKFNTIGTFLGLAAKSDVQSEFDNWTPDNRKTPISRHFFLYYNFDIRTSNYRTCIANPVIAKTAAR
jgi:hypothetical protein